MPTRSSGKPSKETVTDGWSRNPVTLREVARDAGVHISTASRALNPETRSIVNDRTAERVLTAAKRLGYRPHPLARGLRTNRTLTVGLTVPDLLNPVFPLLYAGAEMTLREEGYSLLVGAADDPGNPIAATGILIDRHVDGLLMANAHVHSTLPQTASTQGTPTVLVNRTTDLINAPTISCDEHAGIGLVVRHLASLGHTAIAHVAGPQDISNGVLRRQAFVAWMHSEGLDTPPEVIENTEGFRVEEGRKACDRLLDSGVHFTAIVAANDLIALGCYDALAERGINVPGDVSVTGYDDVAFIDRVFPPLTTVTVPFYEMGAMAGSVLLSLLSDADDDSRGIPTSTHLRPYLEVRGSTARPTIA